MQFNRDDYEWDDAKESANLIKHQTDFTPIWTFDWHTAVVEETPRYGELRFRAYGYTGGRLHTVIFTLRNGKCRVISLRKANPREERHYAQSRAQA